MSEETTDTAVVDEVAETTEETTETTETTETDQTETPEESILGGDLSEQDKAGEPAPYETFELPENMQLDEGLATGLTPVMREIGIDQEGAQKLATKLSEVRMAEAVAAAQAETDQVQAHLATIKADTDFGGIHFDDTTKHARLFVEKAGGPAFKQLMKDHPAFANNPEMIKTFARVGKRLFTEDELVTSDEHITPKKSAVDVMFPKMKEDMKKMGFVTQS